MTKFGTEFPHRACVLRMTCQTGPGCWVGKHKKCVEVKADYVEKVRCSLDLNDI